MIENNITCFNLTIFCLFVLLLSIFCRFYHASHPYSPLSILTHPVLCIVAQVLSKVFLWNRVQLWLKEDMKAVLASQPRGVKKGPFLALQIDGAAKRGGEAEDDFWLIEVEVSLVTA